MRSLGRHLRYKNPQPPNLPASQFLNQARAAALPDPLENKQQKEEEPELRVRDRGAQQLISLLLTHLIIRLVLSSAQDQVAKFLQQTINLAANIVLVFAHIFAVFKVPQRPLHPKGAKTLDPKPSIDWISLDP